MHMTVFARDQLDTLVNKISEKNVSQVYLLFGERYLCQQAAEKIVRALTVEGGNVHSIDGLQEDYSVTLGKLTSFSLFTGRQVFRINDTRLFHSSRNAHSLWKKCSTAYRENNRPLATGYLRTMLEAAGMQANDPENDPADLSAARWKKLFGFAKPQENLEWTRELLSIHPIDAPGPKQTSAKDPAQLFEEIITSGLPKQNVVVLLTEDVDKRKRLFKTLTEQFAVVDLSVETGSGSNAQKNQLAVLTEVLRHTLAGYGKTMASAAAGILFERVGFHPVAVAMEAEKLALYVGSRSLIREEDIEAIIGRTRQDALFELTDVLGKRELEKALRTAEHLLENGIHPLAIIAAIRNYLHNLLLFRALQDQPETGYSKSMAPALFQKQCLPRLKLKEHWKQELSGHPYAVYMQFKTAASFSLSTLKSWLFLVLKADFRLKGSIVAPDIIIQHLIVDMLANGDYDFLKKYRGGLH